jgi:hypothetical protein
MAVYFKEKWNLQAGDRQEELDCAISLEFSGAPAFIKFGKKGT